MASRKLIPEELGDVFSVQSARRSGVGYDRLRGSDLARPFHGVRRQDRAVTTDEDEELDPFEQQRRDRVNRAREYQPRMHPDHYFSHETAASIWGAPLPISITEFGTIGVGDELAVHVGAIGPVALPRARGVTHHRSRAGMVTVREHQGFRVTSPATTWANLGTLRLPDVIALGDYFCRAWRQGIGRRYAGRRSLATIDELRAALAAGRRRGAVTLREAIEWIREDAWSPRESRVRYELVRAGLPEPELNVDLFDSARRFLGCVDMLYRKARVVVEYHGILHSKTWADDVERVARMRAAGFTVIEVTTKLLENPEELVRRVRRALGL